MASLSALGQEQGWFNDDGEGFEGYWQNLDDGEIDRGGRKLALVRGMQAERLSLYAVGGFPDRPVLACDLGEPDGAFAGPNWSPDGMALAWYENNGVWVSPAPADLTVPGACEEFFPVGLIAGASEPRWGLADVSSVTATPTATRTGSPKATTTTPPPSVATSTRTATPTGSSTPTTPPADRTPIPCPGDCGGDGHVGITDLVLGVKIAMNSLSLDSCPAFDFHDSGHVTIDELLAAVDAALRGCPG